MDQNTGGMSCTLTCWLIALLGGILLAVLLMMFGDFSATPAIFLGLLAFLIAGWLLSTFLCGGSAASADTGAQSSSATASAGAATSVAAAAGGAAVASGLMSSDAAAEQAPAEKAPVKKPAAKKPAAKKPAAKKPAAKKPAAKKPAAKPAATPAKAASTTPKRKPVAKDGKPELLKKARKGGADDLKQIKGVGPGLEKTLNDMGIWHFDQVAGWRKKEVEWVDERLKFKGRIERDEWIKQAKTLAKGGATEFSKRVKKGGVY